jgi:lipopolysaccharide transport system ATP-binding protein
MPPYPTFVIRTEGLSKLYTIGNGGRTEYRTFRDAIADAFAFPLRLAKRGLVPKSSNIPSDKNFVWALKDVCLEVKQGEILGIVGRNGAGKTTLLKILSRITEPTSGRAELRGRVGSLLEVGTGFHPELTGRENIFLNGAILGMTRQEIQRKFDEIVDFAEIARFIDTPLKRYSSGMGARLAFAVAAHLEPEILLVDEVLAVGDQGFRRKCLGKMKDVGQEGRTVLFISHDMNAISRLCQKALWLEEGKVQAVGEVQDVVSNYLTSYRGTEVLSDYRAERRKPPLSRKYFSRVSLADLQGKPANIFRSGESIRLTLGMQGSAPTNHFVEWFLVDQVQGSRVAWGASYFLLEQDVPSEATEISFVIGPLPLTEGYYTFTFSMGVRDVTQLDIWSDAIEVEIIGANPDGSCHHYSNRYASIIIPYNINNIALESE